MCLHKCPPPNSHKPCQWSVLDPLTHSSMFITSCCLALLVVLLVVVVTFFNHNFVNCKATLILAIKMYEIFYILKRYIWCWLNSFTTHYHFISSCVGPYAFVCVTLQPVLQPAVRVSTLYSSSYNRFYNQLYKCLHFTARCTTGFYRAMGLCLCLSVSVSVTSRCSTKT